ncbi:hypothetical protein R3P38DRAFT_1917329 [Favolaschia claudopus]|uniref:Uncharacterized protein n=1 Tax=Favolaschia claudopus TaxID=2862362 RepID=A0AAW0A1V4_9AGAR
MRGSLNSFTSLEILDCAVYTYASSAFLHLSRAVLRVARQTKINLHDSALPKESYILAGPTTGTHSPRLSCRIGMIPRVLPPHVNFAHPVPFSYSPLTSTHKNTTLTSIGTAIAHEVVRRSEGLANTYALAPGRVDIGNPVCSNADLGRLRVWCSSTTPFQQTSHPCKDSTPQNPLVPHSKPSYPSVLLISSSPRAFPPFFLQVLELLLNVTKRPLHHLFDIDLNLRLCMTDGSVWVHKLRTRTFRVSLNSLSTWYRRPKIH